MHYLFLRSLPVTSLEGACHHQDRLDGTQTPVIVSLLRQQVLAELVQGDELAGQEAGILEALGHQHDLADEFKVWHNHGTRSMHKRRYVVRQEQCSRQ